MMWRITNELYPRAWAFHPILFTAKIIGVYPFKVEKQPVSCQSKTWYYAYRMWNGSMFSSCFLYSVAVLSNPENIKLETTVQLMKTFSTVFAGNLFVPFGFILSSRATVKVMEFYTKLNMGTRRRSGRNASALLLVTLLLALPVLLLFFEICTEQFSWFTDSSRVSALANTPLILRIQTYVPVVIRRVLFFWITVQRNLAGFSLSVSSCVVGLAAVFIGDELGKLAAEVCQKGPVGRVMRDHAWLSGQVTKLDTMCCNTILMHTASLVLWVLHDITQVKSMSVEGWDIAWICYDLLAGFVILSPLIYLSNQVS